MLPLTIPLAVRGGGGNTSDGGDGLASINPDDVESMTILKGATAAALYGSRAKDGVIMITTKTRAKGKGIGVTYNLNYTNETPLDFTDYQYEYGQGENGAPSYNSKPNFRSMVVWGKISARYAADTYLMDLMFLTNRSTTGLTNFSGTDRMLQILFRSP